MATQEDIVQRLDDVSDTLNTVTTTQHLLVELLAGQQEQLTAIREDQKSHQEQLIALREDQKSHQEQLIALREDHKAHQEQLIALREDHNAQMIAIREDLKTHREELKEIRRFNQQTRRMWIMIARNMEWLPEDEDFD